MGGSQFLIWGLSLFLSGCSLGSVAPRMDFWYPNQITPMKEVFGPSFIHLSSNSSPNKPVSADDPTPTEPIPGENKIPSDKPHQQVPASQEQKPAILVPEIPHKDNDEVIVKYKAKIDETQNLLRTINERQLSKEQYDTYNSINSFLEKAQEAFSQNDLSMAMNLSEKANTLTKEIVNNSTKP
ncbi:hypothetical protein [uncultured Nitrospira sp.]|uniref:hypothetical protein n=1 Tax=uncultured Nitrospira sp. TaxID=157176 RepID=UPI0031405EAC